ncbi:hypothetical protein [Altericroceibacterium xinjiangense]|uniref:hypothetical protein n=1 Tax=Altericroceibacterium xinjiangense TaxID=762261 RepID=UPI000F7DC732|nr:hypothetical protein [Altericroceibacterium xinjiangense]
MRLLGRLLLALFVCSVVAALALGFWARLPDWLSVTPDRGERFKDVVPSLVYPLRAEPTEFVFSRPQEHVRLLTNADAVPVGPEPTYAYHVEARDEQGRTVVDRNIYLRSVRLYVRGPDGRESEGRLLPHAFTGDESGLVPSGGDAMLIDFERPVSSIRLAQVALGPGVGRILARVQEYRPVSARQLEVGWDRMSADERESLTAGNPLGPDRVGVAEQERILRREWHPVGPSGVRGRDYRLSALYERPGRRRQLLDRKD